MSLNAASQNPAGIETGSVSGPPPPVSTEIMADLLSSSKNDLLGQHESGKDGDDSGEGNKIKSEKELERDPKNAKQTEELLGSANSAAREIKDKPDSTTEEPLLA